ncbi:hypothetical protein BKA62DRAFT_717554 [Auriculariales sp. MPI-PUGE-AT-0066]|nr:hypothetical protein BKA62DRAFT_717554 [Auriculariales sp. MPI-PUGE-AT-0066]
MSTPVKPAIRQVTQDITTFSVPFKIGFLPLGGRSTAIRLTNGDVWVLASHPIDQDTRQTLDAMGHVKYIVSGDVDHYFFLADYKAAYPNALVIGPDGLQAKLEKQGKGVKLDGVYFVDSDDKRYGFEDEVHPFDPFHGHAKMDVAFYHIASKSLVECDLLFNLPATESFKTIGGTGSIPLLTSLFKPGKFLHNQAIKGMVTDKVKVKVASDAVLALDLERIIPCHGDVLERADDPRGKWEATFKGIVG